MISDVMETTLERKNESLLGKIPPLRRDEPIPRGAYSFIVKFKTEEDRRTGLDAAADLGQVIVRKSGEEVFARMNKEQIKKLKGLKLQFDFW